VQFSNSSRRSLIIIVLSNYVVLAFRWALHVRLPRLLIALMRIDYEQMFLRNFY